MTADVDDIVQRLRSGVPAAVARAITWCEQGGERADALLRALPARAAHVVGVTGAPGAGKSTLVNELLRAYRNADVSVGVVAVDPSSPLTGGALLGDRVRLEGFTGDRGAFFRSLASRGASGGLAGATRAASTVLSAGGFDLVLVETVGAGQGEVDIMRVADTVTLVLTPGAGDEVQALKAGLMEIADLYVINKADRPGVGDLKSQIAALLHTRGASDWRPPVIETIGNERKGIPELVEALEQHRQHLQGGRGEQRRTAGTAAEVTRVARALMEEAVAAERTAVVDDTLAGKHSEADGGRELARRAAQRLLDEHPAPQE